MLLGTRGGCQFQSHDEMSWALCDRTGHSAKPEKIRRLIESVSAGPYLELFGRRVATGWTVFGNQIQKGMFDTDALEV
jgi:N6-adenosine-specific RNA methylase IME4